MARALTVSSGISRDPLLPALLGRTIKHGFGDARDDDVIVGWGQKHNTQMARDFARKTKLPFWCLEDGFFAYLGHPSTDSRRMAMVLDHTGIYYDATAPSDLETLLESGEGITPDLVARAERAMAQVRRWRLSKYNQSAFDLPASLCARLEAFEGPKILVVDQTLGDMSIRLGLATDASFTDMLECALSENPDALVIVKVHPDVLAGTKHGHFDPRKMPERVLLLADDVAPQALIAAVDHVYVVTSQMGFEALIAGKPVTCFGLPFYAGWGLTRDHAATERRTADRTLPELFAAACILYSRYVDPFTHKRVELEDILGLLSAERQLPRPGAERALAVGFSFWKRGFIPDFFGTGVRRVKFVKPSALKGWRYRDGDAVILWGRKHDAEAAHVPAHVPVWRMEDGFLRSVGLGSDLRRPSSLVLDGSGIYYDGGAPSDLETFLQHHDFSDAELTRGAGLRGQILAARVSKYNVGEKGGLDFRSRAGRHEVILVPGQVEADASIRYGSPLIKTNAALLEAVKAAKPDAYIVFKPHPDVTSGNRAGSVPSDILDRCVNETITDADIIDCLEAVDSVHTMTSLTGFEALLRKIPVTTYGMPFYAGWGLTEDTCAFPRRGRTLPLEALVYGALCVYARYVRWPEGLSYGPEALVEDIRQAAASGAGARSGLVVRLARLGRKIGYLVSAVLR